MPTGYLMNTVTRTTLLAWLCTLAVGGGCGPDLFNGSSHPDAGGARGPHCDRVFVLDNKSNLARFDPETLRFEDVGRLPCPLVDTLPPASLAVSHDGDLLVEYPSGDLFLLPLDLRRCINTDFFFGYSGQSYSMSFAANAPGGAQETAYVARQVVSPFVFGIMNLGALDLTQHGYLPADAVLAGTGTADLWAVSRGTTTTVARVDRTMPRLLDELPLADLGDTRQQNRIDLAAAFFRSDLWLFVGAGGSTAIYRVDPRSHALTRVVANAGRRVIAATAPACASY